MLNSNIISLSVSVSLLGVTCPSLSKISNGIVTYNSNLFGTEATYSCLPGYTLSGPTVRTCTENRTWSGEESFCLREQSI